MYVVRVISDSVRLVLLVVFCPLISGLALNILELTFNNGTYHCSFKNGIYLRQILPCTK